CPSPTALWSACVSTCACACVSEPELTPALACASAPDSPTDRRTMLPTARPMESAARVLTEKALTVVEMVRAARTKEVVIWKRILGGFVGRSYVKSFVEGKYIRWKACSPIIVIALVIERRAVRKGRRE